MKRLLVFLGGAAAAFLAFSCVQPTLVGKKSGEILIIYSGNTLGELKPCGCAKEEDQGGFERRTSYLKQTRAGEENTLLVDTGDNLAEPSRQGKIKSGYLLRAMAKMHYDAVSLGDKDLVYGNGYLKEQASIPWVASNITLDGTEIPRVRFKTFPNGLRAAVIAVGDPSLFKISSHSNFHMTDPRERVEQLAGELRKKEKLDLLVALTHMRREQALAFLDLEGVDIVVNGHIESETDLIDMIPVQRGGKIFVQPGPRGQKMGELRVRFDARGNKTYEQRMVRLDSSVKFDPEMVKLYEEYNNQVEELFFASLAARKSKGGQKVYATERVCRTCHPQAHDIWKSSRHGRAYQTLKRVNKAFDPECLVCHVVGFNQTGGFVSEVDTPDLQNVQCEICHGPGLKHARAPGPGFGKEAAQACMKCHIKSHSPRFNYADYWPKIKH